MRIFAVLVSSFAVTGYDVHITRKTFWEEVILAE